MVNAAPRRPAPATLPAPSATTPWPSYLPTGRYADLKRRVQQAGLLDRQPRYYTLKIVGTLALLFPSVIVLLTVGNLWVQLVNAVYLAAVSAQIAFLGHDVGHRQVVHAGRFCSVLELVFGNVLTGVSSTWWLAKHNLHHSHPNRAGHDPDITLPVVAFSAKRARAMNRMQQLVVRHQHELFVFMLLFEGLVLRISSIQYLLLRRGGRWALELLLLALYFGGYGWLVFHQLGLYPGLAFVAVNQMAFGLYMGSVFAPNHKGMPVFEAGEDVDFLLEQVLTSRNVDPSPAVDFLFGGLNYQIEHHLFPTLARNRLRDAQTVVREFCSELSIPYCQTSVVRSYRVIWSHLRTVGAAAHSG